MWLSGLGRRPEAELRLFCLPYAGGGASTFGQWPASLPNWIEACPIQLPGREQRLREPPFTDLSGLIAALTPVIERHGDKPFAIFGHSMGAVVAFELARALQRRHARMPARLFASAHRAPQEPRAESSLRPLGDPELVAELTSRYDAIPAEIAREPAFLRLLLPLWRADFSLIETYAYEAGPRLACPISVFAGDRDPFTLDDDLELWRAQTAAALALRVFAGGHFFIESARSELLAALSDDLAPARSSEPKSAGEPRDPRST